MEQIKTQDCYLPITDNVESPYSVYAWTGIDQEKSFVTAVERHTDLFLHTKEQLEKIIGDAFEAGEKRQYGIMIYRETSEPGKPEYINSIMEAEKAQVSDTTMFIKD